MSTLLHRLLPLGHAGLRVVCAPVTDIHDPSVFEDASRLMATLRAFRRTHGFGRAISAPQIGIAKRFIAFNLHGRELVMYNPEIVWSSPETFTMWDDCMSFPGLLVRVARRHAVCVRYTDEQGKVRTWEGIDLPTSELIQHETDHLDGVLALDRALDRESIISREAFAQDPDRFRAQVDYVIEPARPEPSVD